MTDDDAFFADLNNALPEVFRLRIGELIIASAGLDTAISFWMVMAFGIPMDAGSILIGNMDTKSKLDRMVQLYEHYGRKGQAKAIKSLAALHRAHAEQRNVVAHQRCVGTLRSEPETIVFNSVRHTKGELGTFRVVLLPVAEIIASTVFASKAEKLVTRFAEGLSGPIVTTRTHYGP